MGCAHAPIGNCDFLQPRWHPHPSCHPPAARTAASAALLSLQGRAAAAAGAGACGGQGGRVPDRQAQGGDAVGDQRRRVQEERRAQANEAPGHICRLPPPQPLRRRHPDAPDAPASSSTVAALLQAHFASTGPKKSEAQTRAQQADLMSKLPEVRGGLVGTYGAAAGRGTIQHRGSLADRAGSCMQNHCERPSTLATLRHKQQLHIPAPA
jgi:hypothetical protein